MGSPLLAAAILFLGGVASNWVAADLQDDLEPFRPWVWGAFALALLTTLVLAMREWRAAPLPLADDRVTGAVHDSENVLIGNDNIQIIIGQVVAGLAAQLPQQRLSEEQFRSVAIAYLELLVNRYRYLDFKGMGVNDRVVLRMPLLEMYVPLRARRTMPGGETLAHELRLAGRRLSEEEAAALVRICWRVAGRDANHSGSMMPPCGKLRLLQVIASG